MGEPASSAGTSPDDYDDNVAVELRSDKWSSQQSTRDGPSSPVADGGANSPPSGHVPVAMQKRRRVTRACDECRRKKIKCDGKQPCTHCTVYNYECTYDRPSNRRRNPAPQYVEALENRLQFAESLLRNVLPEVNLDDPKFNVEIPRRVHIYVKQEEQSPMSSMAADMGLHEKKLLEGMESDKDPILESMVHEAGALDLDDQGNWDFYGSSSGMIFLRRMREQFGDLMGKAEGAGAPFMKGFNLAERLGSPQSTGESPVNATEINIHDLPDRSCARTLCSCALDDAAALLRFVHQPSFYEMFDRVYSTPPENFKTAEQKFLPLLYSVLALGCLFAKSEKSMLQSYGYESAIDQGFNWFRISRKLIDITDCRDLTSLQTILFMIMFLQASFKLNTCYSHVGIALRSAMRMGLHRSVSNEFPPIERETRKRIFWVIRNMDIYVGALLGLPTMLSDDDTDQEFPLEVDDEYITSNEILPMPPGKTSVITAFNAHIKLVKILAKTVKYVYPLQTMRVHSEHAFVVRHAKIREVEQDLQQWMEDLPMALRPGGEEPTQLVRIQQLLRMAYGHVQIVLYRPFLHYASQSIPARMADKRSYACAAACVSVSRNVVHIVSEMKRRGFLVGAYWFTMYTTFFAVLSLVFYVLENPRSATSETVFRDAREGRDTLASLAPRSRAADRSSQVLARLFEQLPAALKSGRSNSGSQRKRAAPTKHASLTSSTPNPSTNNISVEKSADGASIVQSSDAPPWNSHLHPPEEPTAPQQLPQNFGATLQLSPPNSNSPSDRHSISFQHTPSPTAGVPASANQPSFPPLRSSGKTGVSDLSTMMFPSTDPFAYPNQPMTTLESYRFTQQDQPFDPQLYNVARAGGSYNDPSAQLYGSLSSYSMQGANSQMDLSGSRAQNGSMHGSSSQGWTQQTQPMQYGGPPGGGLNWDTIFGEDWSGAWTEQAYR